MIHQILQHLHDNILTKEILSAEFIDYTFNLFQVILKPSRRVIKEGYDRELAHKRRLRSSSPSFIILDNKDGRGEERRRRKRSDFQYIVDDDVENRGSRREGRRQRVSVVLPRSFDRHFADSNV